MYRTRSAACMCVYVCLCLSLSVFACDAFACSRYYTSPLAPSALCIGDMRWSRCRRIRAGTSALAVPCRERRRQRYGKQKCIVSPFIQLVLCFFSLPALSSISRRLFSLSLSSFTFVLSFDYNVYYSNFQQIVVDAIYSHPLLLLLLLFSFYIKRFFFSSSHVAAAAADCYYLWLCRAHDNLTQ